MRFQFVALSTGQVVEGWYEADEDQQQKTTFNGFDFKSLTNGKIAKKIAFVNSSGQKVKLF